MRNFLNTLLVILLFVFLGCALVGAVGGFIYQMIEYGRYIDFIIYNHWTTWLTIIGGVGILIDYILLHLIGF